MKGLQHYRFEFVGTRDFMDFRPFNSFSMPFTDTWLLGILLYGLDWNGRFTPESLKSCRALSASDLMLIGLLGLNTE